MSRGYKLVCFSLFLDDVELLGELVNRARSRGDRRTNKSSLVRRGLRLLNLQDWETAHAPELREAGCPTGSGATLWERLRALADCADAVRQMAGPPPGDGYEPLGVCVERLRRKMVYDAAAELPREAVVSL